VLVEMSTEIPLGTERIVDVPKWVEISGSDDWRIDEGTHGAGGMGAVTID
jgi:hypothetical protein